MSHREYTVQQLDPLAGVNGRALTVFGSVAVVLFAIVMTVLNRDDLDSPVLAVAAIGVLCVSVSLVIVVSSPLRPPVSRSVHIAAVSLALLALVISTISMLESNAFIQDDWGTIAIGGVCLILCPYRPPRELLVVGVLACLFAGVVVLVQVRSLDSTDPAFVAVVIALTPLACLSFAGVAFATIVLRMLLRWQSRASRAVSALADEHREGIARSVQQDRITILNRDVVPFFSDVLGRDELTDADREHAREISDSLRSIMVAEADRSWLDVVVGQASGGSLPATAVDDPDRLASGMSTDQRTAMRATLVAIVSHPGFLAEEFWLSIAPQARPQVDGGAGEPVTSGVIRASFELTEPAPRTAFAPYLAVLRVVFVDLQVDVSASSLTVRFSYAQQ